MIQRFAKYTTYIVVMTMMVGCASSRVPISDFLRQQYSLQEAQLQQLQVYLSQPITLERVVDDTGSRVSEGELEVFGSRIEQIEISTKTPGVVLEATDIWAKVSFSPGTFLYFGNAIDDSNDPWAGQYALLAERWSGGVGYLEFDGEAYRAIRRSGEAVLEIRKNDLNDDVVAVRKLEGVTLDETD